MRLELEPEERERDIDSGVRPRKIADLRCPHRPSSEVVASRSV